MIDHLPPGPQERQRQGVKCDHLLHGRPLRRVAVQTPVNEVLSIQSLPNVHDPSGNCFEEYQMQPFDREFDPGSQACGVLEVDEGIIIEFLPGNGKLQ